MKNIHVNQEIIRMKSIKEQNMIDPIDVVEKATAAEFSLSPPAINDFFGGVISILFVQPGLISSGS